MIEMPNFPHCKPEIMMTITCDIYHLKYPVINTQKFQSDLTNIVDINQKLASKNTEEIIIYLVQLQQEERLRILNIS